MLSKQIHFSLVVTDFLVESKCVTHHSSKYFPKFPLLDVMAPFHSTHGEEQGIGNVLNAQRPCSIVSGAPSGVGCDLPQQALMAGALTDFST